MSARRLGRLVGSVLALAALVGGIILTDVTQAQDDFEWLGDFHQMVVQQPASAVHAQTSTGAH